MAEIGTESDCTPLEMGLHARRGLDLCTNDGAINLSPCVGSLNGTQDLFVCILHMLLVNLRSVERGAVLLKRAAHGENLNFRLATRNHHHLPPTCRVEHPCLVSA